MTERRRCYCVHYEDDHDHVAHLTRLPEAEYPSPAWWVYSLLIGCLFTILGLTLRLNGWL